MFQISRLKRFTLHAFFRSGPSVQANCVLALAGLALTTTQYANGLDEAGTAAAKEATEHLGHPHWLSIMTNTLMGLLDPQNPPQGRVFSLCQQVSLMRSNAFSTAYYYTLV